MITVNSARKEIGPQIKDISEKTLVFNKAELSCVSELWDEYIAQGQASGYTFLVAEEGEKVTGFVCYGPHALTEGAFDLYWIAVDPDFQNKGIGRALIEKVAQEVSNLRGSLLIAETSSTLAYKPAREFYEHNGFFLEATVHDFYAQNDHLLIYTIHLNRRKSLHEDHLFIEA